MKEVPMLFDAESVRGILAGIKIQTRRVLKPQPEHVPDGYYFDAYNGGPNWNFWTPDDKMANGIQGDKKNSCQWRAKCQVGTILWGKETFCNHPYFSLIYRADKPDGEPPNKNWDDVWTPSIFMPRKFSRLLLRVTEVRVQRVQDISPEDAIAEGLLCDEFPIGGEMVKKYGCAGWQHQWLRQSPVDAYERRWNEVNGKDSWQRNEWCWCYTFERIT
jgi:hypothetical protein